jgi:TonB family protein
MKKAILLVFMTLFAVGFSQPLQFTVRGAYAFGANSEALREVRFMHQMIPFYTGSGVMKYLSTEVSAGCNGKELKATGRGDTLTAEQREVISQAEPGTDIVITIKYTFNNKIVPDKQAYTIQHVITVLPEVTASFASYKEMLQYLKLNTIDKLCDPNCKKFPFATVRFTVNENGDVIGVRIGETSADPKVDEVLIEAIRNMPKWKPAQNSKGKKVKQEFQFSIGTDVKTGC